MESVRASTFHPALPLRHGSHRILVYDDERQLVAGAGTFLDAGLLHRGRVIVFARPENVVALRQRMGSHRVVWLEAESVLALVRGPDGRIDPRRFDEVLGDTVRQA